MGSFIDYIIFDKIDMIKWRNPFIRYNCITDKIYKINDIFINKYENNKLNRIIHIGIFTIIYV
jgi:hypothetical protein